MNASRSNSSNSAEASRGPASAVDAPDTAPDDVVLECHDLHKHYRMGSEDLHVLRGVELNVRAGQWLAVLGASGSGKSTLLHVLGGLDRPSQGSVQFMGRHVFDRRQTHLDSYRNRSVGFVFQFYHLLPELTAWENVAIAGMMGSSGKGQSRASLRSRACDLLSQMGLGERLKHKPNKLSGGERQRVAIGRALINQPAVLLADEPTGNLDAATGGRIIDILAKLHSDGQTIIMVTHDATIAHKADRTLTLDRGQLKSN